MAHSNRQKLRDERGGKTRHQSVKAGRQSRYRSTFDAQERIRELDAWQRRREEERAQGPRQSLVVKTRRIPMNPPVIERRKGALARLQAALALTNTLVKDMDKDELSAYQSIHVARVEREIKTLLRRI